MAIAFSIISECIFNMIALTIEMYLSTVPVTVCFSVEPASMS